MFTRTSYSLEISTVQPVRIYTYVYVYVMPVRIRDVAHSKQRTQRRQQQLYNCAMHMLSGVSVCARGSRTERESEREG